MSRIDPRYISGSDSFVLFIEFVTLKTFSLLSLPWPSRHCWHSSHSTDTDTHFVHSDILRPNSDWLLYFYVREGVKKKKKKKGEFSSFCYFCPPPRQKVDSFFFFFFFSFLDVSAHSKHIWKKNDFSLENLKTLRKFTPIWSSEEAEPPHHPLTPLTPPHKGKKFLCISGRFRQFRI